MDSSFSDDSIDECGDENLQWRKMFLNSSQHYQQENIPRLTPVQNAPRVRPANNRGRDKKEIGAVSTHSYHQGRSQMKLINSVRVVEQMPGKFPDSDRNILKLQDEIEQRYLQQQPKVLEDDKSVGSVSETSTPVRTWHWHECRADDRSNHVQTHLSEDSRISKAWTAIESSSALRSTPTSVPSVQSVPQLSRCR
jgi:hypothetical protein